MSDRRLTLRPSRTPAPPCKGTYHRDAFSSRLTCTRLPAHRPGSCKPDERKPRARRSRLRRKLIHARARAFDQKTDRESPCPLERIALAGNQPLTPKEYAPPQAISFRRCSREMEAQSG